MPDNLPATGPLQCTIVTPETTVRDGVAEFVVVPLYDGELGIAQHHAPLIGRLGYGELRIKHGGTTESYYVDGGFVQLSGSTISVLTNRAVPAKNLDPQAAAELLASAREKPAHSPELLAIRERLTAQARAQLRVAQRAH